MKFYVRAAVVFRIIAEPPSIDLMVCFEDYYRHHQCFSTGLLQLT